ncbi:MAG: hypothetical protein ABSG97_04090 [Sedimentisphaerales bacterium]|jgi:hypothetical protein
MANFEKLAKQMPIPTEALIDCSVVVPLYNESAVAQELYERLTRTG